MLTVFFSFLYVIFELSSLHFLLSDELFLILLHVLVDLTVRMDVRKVKFRSSAFL